MLVLVDITDKEEAAYTDLRMGAKVIALVQENGKVCVLLSNPWEAPKHWVRSIVFRAVYVNVDSPKPGEIYLGSTSLARHIFYSMY